MAEFGEKLKKCREEKGITQQTLAEYVYVTRQTISRYETGERYPDIITLKKLSSILGVSTDYLLGDEEIIKVVEKNPIVDKPLFNNITIALYTLIVATYAVFIFNQTPFSSFIKEATSKGGSYLWFVFISQILSICLFIYGLFVVLKGSMSPKKTGFIMMGYLILEGSKSFYYLSYGALSNDFTMIPFSLFIVAVYALGVVCAYLYFVKNKNTHITMYGVIGIAIFGIYRELQSVYHLLMIADHLYSWINSLLAFLMITINILFIYQAIILNIKRKKANEINELYIADKLDRIIVGSNDEKDL